MGKLALGVQKEKKKKAFEAVLRGMKTAMRANIPLLITACLLNPPTAFARPHQQITHDSSSSAI